MTFSRNTLLAAVVTLASFVAVNEAQACRGGRSGGGYSGRYSGGYSSRSYNSYSNNSYGYQSSGYRYQQPVLVRQQPVLQPIAPQPVFQQPVAPQLQQVSQQQLAPQQPSVQQVPQQQLTQVPQTQVPQTQVAPQQIAQPQATAPAQTQAPVDAQMSALQALGGFAPPQNASAPQIQTPAHVGKWTATLGNGATVRLTLQADGTFNWVATNKAGSASSFSGTYTAANGSLTLNRGNDNQQLGGSMTISGTNAFSFKVAGNNAASIDFNRS